MLLAIRDPGLTAGGMMPAANMPGGALAATEPLPADRSEWASRHPSAASLGLDHVDNGTGGVMFLKWREIIGFFSLSAKHRLRTGLQGYGCGADDRPVAFAQDPPAELAQDVAAGRIQFGD